MLWLNKFLANFICWFFFPKNKLVYKENITKKTPILYIAIIDDPNIDSILLFKNITGITKIAINSTIKRFNFIKLLLPISNIIDKIPSYLASGNNVLLVHDSSIDIANIINSYTKHKNLLTVQLVTINNQETVLGSSLYFSYNPRLTSQEHTINIKSKIKTALGEITINPPDKSYDEHIKQLATAATFDNDYSYFKTLKVFEKSIATDISIQFITFKNSCKSHALKLIDGFAVFPSQKYFEFILINLFYLLVIAISTLLNIIPTVITIFINSKCPNIDNLKKLNILTCSYLFWGALFFYLCLSANDIIAALFYTLITFATPKILGKIHINKIAYHNLKLYKSGLHDFLKLRLYIAKYLNRNNADQPALTNKYFSY